MPNKRRIAKLQTKLLASGKLKSTAKAQSVLKYLAEKAAIDNEDVDYDYDLDKNNDFEKITDDTTKVVKGAKHGKKPGGVKRNKQPDDSGSKKAKFEAPQVKPVAKKGEAVLPKKSKKNKYFFMAHPEALDKKDALIQSAKSDFVIDEEKFKMIEAKKKANKGTEANGKKKKTEKKSKDSKSNGRKPPSHLFKNNNLWHFEPCSSSDEEDNNGNQPTEGGILDIDNIDKGFEIKKFIEKLEDGTTVEVFKPVPIANDNGKHTKRNGDESDDEEDGNEEEEEEEVEDQEGAEESSDDPDEEEEEQEEPETDIKETSQETNGNGSSSSVRSMMMEKLKASRFRYLNELLYTQPSAKSYELFEK